ncbi:hypothetical protein ILYODFUR_037459 [Ilyodon furcidens]|uniref:Uncharacterized protein n=1 Tax=Ilyodon furcidens TaxID=33524 RepID=A0ABV0TRU3_9TELE
MLSKQSFPLQWHRLVCQNRFEVNKQSFSMSSPNPSSFYLRVFTSATAWTTECLASWYLSDASAVPGLIGLLPHFNSVPYCQCQPSSSGIDATMGTTDLTATATGGSIKDRGGEHGPLRLCLQPPPGSRKSTRLELNISVTKTPSDVHSRPSLYAWAGLVCPAFSSSNSPPGGAWIAWPLSSSMCSRYGAEGV